VRCGIADVQLNRVRDAEDRFLQDLIEAEYRELEEEEEALDSEDEAGQRMLQDRKLQARQRALRSRAASDHQLAQTLLEGKAKEGESFGSLWPMPDS
jgi:vacuolar-type H+-ATPase subunit H